MNWLRTKSIRLTLGRMVAIFFLLQGFLVQALPIYEQEGVLEFSDVQFVVVPENIRVILVALHDYGAVQEFDEVWASLQEGVDNVQYEWMVTELPKAIELLDQQQVVFEAVS
jgi:hypothetical protein